MSEMTARTVPQLSDYSFSVCCCLSHCMLAKAVLLYSNIMQANKIISFLVCVKLDLLKIPGIEFLALD